MMTRSLILAFIIAGTAFAQSGYRIAADQVVVDSRTHWQSWNFPPGVLDLGSSGTVQPRSLRRDINAVGDIVANLRARPPDGLKKDPEDIVLADAILGGARSNVAGVENLFDGDMTTYWEPDPPTEELDLSTQWWFIVDLGRLVMAKKLVLKFVDEELGDPFLQFDLLASQGNIPKGNQRSPTPEFTTILRTLKPNKEQRVFELVTNSESTFAGAGMRFVQIIITGSDFDRGREVSLAQYEALPASDQGAIEFYKRQADGSETVVSPEIYELLTAEQQGPIRYFQRERPRLAELEVWAEGDEILTGTLARGGYGTATQTAAINNLIDGQIESKVQFLYSFGRGSFKDPEGIVFFDLGAFYWIDAFRMAYGGSPFKDYRLDFSDGSLEADGSLKWTTTGTRQTSAPTAVGSKWESETNLRFGTYEGNDFERVKARFFRLVWEQVESATARGGATGQPSEIQLYGQGYHPEVALTSNLIRLGGSRNLLSIEWDADTPPGTSVVLQTRTGNELDEVLRYFKKDGTEVTEAEYNKLLSIFRGDTIGEEVAGGDWSDWSAPYEDASGSPITSPSPRAYLEVRAVLRSDTPDYSATLRSIRLNFTNPVAQGLSGEVTPFAVEQLGQSQRFSLYVRPQFAAGDPGFDQLLVVAPSDMRLAFEGVYGGPAAALATDVGADWALEGAEVVPTAGDSLQVAFSAIDPSSEVEVVRLDFSTALFSTGAVLQASLQHSVEGEGGWQRVDPGEAVAEVVSNTTTLVGKVASGPLVQAVSVEPAVFTPNGDGINDEASFRFTVVKVGDDSPVEVLIYDLQGRLVRRLAEQRALSTGAYGIAWDGRDEQGVAAPPGVYLARLRVDTDTEGSQIGNAEIFRTIAVAY
ncbi:MAG: hypothetical protein F4Z57_02270 [Gemmatimonadetes bacterium]|nr:hypothetical protein [Gemmatimonadota bacterium]